jgi:parvulin-like peptidyl-prolyl isomerase
LILVAWTAAIMVSSTASLAADVLDRVVASVGYAAITASDVEQEYRFECFLDGQWPAPAPDAAALARVRERLTYQILLSHEEDPSPADQAECQKAAVGRLATQRKGFPTPEAFQAAAHELGMTEAEIVARMAQQNLMLRLVDQRLRPAASPSDAEVAEYYRQIFVPEFQKKNPGAAAPPLPEVENQIREVLTEKHIDELLDQWIEELKPGNRVSVHSF